MQQGQFLVNKIGEKRKILGMCGEVIFISKIDNFEVADENIYTKKELEVCGYSLLEEPWRPKNGEAVWLVTDAGGFHQAYWNENDLFCKYRLSVGNFHRIREDAEVYKQKLIERMGRKEN